MNKLLAALVATLFAAGSAFAADAKKEEAKKDAPKAEAKKDEKKPEAKKEEKKAEAKKS